MRNEARVGVFRVAVDIATAERLRVVPSPVPVERFFVVQILLVLCATVLMLQLDFESLLYKHKNQSEIMLFVCRTCTQHTLPS